MKKKISKFVLFMVIILLLVILPARMWYTENSGIVSVSAENNKEYNVLQYGAIRDGKTLNSIAIQQAIDACNEAGGGKVYFPAGNYLTGTIVIKSNVTLHLEEGAIIWGSSKIEDYKSTNDLGSTYKGSSKYLIFAADAENIGFSGNGRINGNGNSEAFWKPKQPLSEDGKPQWREPAERPSKLVEFIGCQDVHIEDITLENSPSWTLHLLKCDRVTVKGINICNEDFLRNQDGIDIDACKDVDISDCTVLTTDDAIVIKNTNTYNTKRPSGHIRVTNCTLSTLCNAFKIGTETQDDIEDVVFSNSKIYSHFLEKGIVTPQNPESGIALMTMDGGNISGITISNITISDYRVPLYVRLGNRGSGQKVRVPGTLKNISIDHLSAVGAVSTPFISGLPQHDIEGVKLTNITIETAGGKMMKSGVKVAENPETYPMPTMFGDLPAYGIYARHVNGLVLENVKINTKKPDERHGIFTEDVKNLDFDQLQLSPPSAQYPLIMLVQSKEALIQNCDAPEGTYNFISIKGDLSEGIMVKKSDLTKSEIPFLMDYNGNADVFSQSDNILPTGITVIMDGQVQKFNPSACMINNRVLVPMREIFEKLDATVQWDESNMEIHAVKEGTEIRLQIGNKTANKDGAEIDLDQPPVIINGSTMVPVRFVSEVLGVAVKWEENTQTVGISTPNKEAYMIENMVEAEDMTLSGYIQEKNTSASNGICIKTSAVGTAKFNYTGLSGTYQVTVGYFDETDGISNFKLYIAGEFVDQWSAEQNLGSASPIAETLITRTMDRIKIKNGDEIKIEGTGNGGEPARIDYIEIR